LTAPLPEGITLRRGLPVRLRPEAARIYWQAFGGKLGAVMGPESRALAFLERAISADHAIVALDAEGRLLGLAGFKTPAGSFAGGTADDLRANYGRLGGAWRAALLRLLQDGVDNDRFLVDGICVRQGMRGQGLGRQLLEALCHEARARGYNYIRLDVIDTNWRARALYEREGFVAIRSERIGWLRYVFGFAAATTMVKPLV
jgi:ribosomal protein S18 acetylase RimI-like enzyme